MENLRPAARLSTRTSASHSDVLSPNRPRDPAVSVLPLLDGQQDRAKYLSAFWQCRALPSRPHIQPICADFLAAFAALGVKS